MPATVPVALPADDPADLAPDSATNIGTLVEKAGESATRAPTNPTVLYQKAGASGEHLKFGITNRPATGYTQKELGGGRLNIVARGTCEEMLELERNVHENLPIGPEEAQSLYIQIQIEKGLKPPPYGP